MSPTTHLETEGLMVKKFNTTGLCMPEKHYMVDISKKVNEIMHLIDDECYFTINRGRQYGKTTTLHAIASVIPSQYTCVNISFEGTGDGVFANEEAFCKAFLTQIAEALENTDPTFAPLWKDESITNFAQLNRRLNALCKDRKIVLLIDEVDATSNNRVFLCFLGVLRNKFLERHRDNINTFHSVILAGVYDVKTIKLKLAQEGVAEQPGEFERSYNSPWNIATEFNVDMSFSPQEIVTMLTAYENDHHTGMDILEISQEIYDYTSGYPVLVSKICKHIAESGNQNWSVRGVKTAVQIITSKKNVLFDDIFKNLRNNKNIHDFLYDLLIVGEKRRRSIYDPNVDWCNMFGYTGLDAMGHTVISNKIFEIVLLDYFSSKGTETSQIENAVYGGIYHEIVKDGKFDMALCLVKFAEHYRDLYSPYDITFLERHGRMIFLSFLKPLVNGHGFFHIESQFTDVRRMDVVVDYGREQFIIELKLWKGERAQEQAYAQLLSYMDSKRLDKGYLLTFDFRKQENREPKSEWVNVGKKEIFDVIV